MTSAIARMNCFLHGIEDFKIERGDTLAEPKFVEGDRLMRFDVALAIPSSSGIAIPFPPILGAVTFTAHHRKGGPTTPSGNTSVLHSPSTIVNANGDVKMKTACKGFILKRWWAAIAVALEGGWRAESKSKVFRRSNVTK